MYSISQYRWFNFGLCKIKLEELQHDVLNSCCHLEINNKKLIYITDTGSVSDIEAKNYDIYLIEANYHSREEIEQKIAEAQEKGEFTHLVRVLNTHLFEGDAINWLETQMGDNSVYEFIHISKENGDKNE